MNPIIAVTGALLLLPGLCGTFFFGLTLLPGNGSREEQDYMSLFMAVAVPSIQIGCLGLWLMARESANETFRSATRFAGWFGAIAAAIMIVRFVLLANRQNDSFVNWLGFVAIGAAIAILPFLIGGFLAIRLPKHPQPTASPK